jgi:aminocarboxymuconate-semialdehyde decarboxylase
VGNVTIIDTQTHWYPPVLWEAYLDLEQYPHCRRREDGYAFELAPDRWFPIRPVFYELELQMREFEAVGIEAVISSPGSFGGVDRFEVRRAAELAVAINEEYVAAQRAYPGQFYGLATIPWQDTDAALQVLDDAIGRLGLRGVLIHSNINGRPIDSEPCRPIYERIAELDVPLFLHPARTIAEEKLRDWGLEYLVGFMFDTTAAALRLVLSGIASDNPTLKVVHPHCGAGLPYLAGRVNQQHSKPYSLGKRLPIAPSDQLASFYTDTLSQNPDTLAFALNFYHEGHVMFASDFPFLSPQEELDFVRNALPATRADAILGGNAADLLKIR